MAGGVLSELVSCEHHVHDTSHDVEVGFSTCGYCTLDSVMSVTRVK